jgi:4-hydroxy-2-oxoheptanedioate aldolase
MLQALAITDTPTFVRVAQNSPKEIGQALDAGAAGIIVPLVNSREEAIMAVRAARYPPAGTRSWGATRLGSREAAGAVRREALLLVMLETVEAFENARSIVSVPGIDGVFVGPSDLAMSLGLGPTDVRHEDVSRRCNDLVALCREYRIRAGIAAHSSDQARDWLATGFRMVSIGRDLPVLLERMRERLDAVRGTDEPG